MNPGCFQGKEKKILSFGVLAFIDQNDEKLDLARQMILPGRLPAFRFPGYSLEYPKHDMYALVLVFQLSNRFHNSLRL